MNGGNDGIETKTLENDQMIFQGCVPYRKCCKRNSFHLYVNECALSTRSTDCTSWGTLNICTVVPSCGSEKYQLKFHTLVLRLIQVN